MNVRSLFDGSSRKTDKDNEKKKVTQSFAGGEKSGIAIENPGDSDKESDTDETGLSRIISRARNSGATNMGIGMSNLPEDSRKVTIYKNGFVVDDGPFRPSSEPNNRDFLKELASGFAPRELQEAARNKGGPVHVAIDDRRTEEFRLPSPPKYTLFGGEGQALSSSPRRNNDAVLNLGSGRVTLRPGEPTTRLVFRFHTGQRGTQEFNETHTIADLHNYVMQVAPLSGGYVLLSGVPPRPIASETKKTLKAADLLNETITQRAA